MSECPHHSKLRTDLPPMTPRIAKLPVGKNGYPIPFFVAEVNGSREDFRVADSAKVVACVNKKLCWVCGEPLGIYKAFVIGPMCVVNRVSGDPASHLECAVYSCKSCPFLLRPQMVRREDDRTEEMEANVGGIMIKRNPGAMAIWVTKSFTIERQDPKKSPLFRLGDPVAIQWWREGRAATRAEIEESINTGLPLLRGVCESQEENDALDQAVKTAQALLPAR